MRLTKERTGRLLAAGSAAAIAIATLTPIAADPIRSSPLCLACGELGGVDLALNILLFLPLGFGLALAGLRLRWCLLAGVAATLTIELMQLRVISGRDASLGDLIANSIGAMLGAAMGRAWPSLVRPSVSLARRLAAGAAIVAFSILGISAWLLPPSVPYLRLWSQWTPQHRRFAPFEGRLLSVTVNGRSLPPAEEVIALQELRGALLGGDTRIEATVVAGAAPKTLSAIVRVANPLLEAFLVGQREDELIFRLRTRSADLRFRTPNIALQNAFPISPVGADTVRLAGGLRNGVLFVERRGRSMTSRADVALSPSLGWVFMLPIDHALGPHYRWASALWIVVLGLPLGYWAAAARGRGRSPLGWQLLPAIWLVIGMGVLPLAASLPMAHWSEWCAGLASAALGAFAFALVRRDARRSPLPASDSG